MKFIKVTEASGQMAIVRSDTIIAVKSIKMKNGKIGSLMTVKVDEFKSADHWLLDGLADIVKQLESDVE